MSLLLQGQVLTLALVSGAKVGKKKKKDVENTLKDSYPAKHSRDVSEHLKEQAAFKREFSFTELGIHAKGESAS